MGLQEADLISSAKITEDAANSLQRNPLDSSESVLRIGAKEITTTWVAEWERNCRETENVTERSQREAR
jgi:hypothetical protein